MKKQIAIMMAAATAVTTVAPALVHADVNTKEDVSISEVVGKIKKALDTKYKSDMQDGINTVNADKPDSYMNSRYIVLISVAGGIEPSMRDEYGVELYENSDYAQADFEINAKDGFAKNQCFVVKDADKIQNLIESKVFSKKTVKVAIIDKGIKDDSSVYKMTNKHYVVEGGNEDTTVSLTTLANELLAKYKKSPTYVDSLKVTNKEGDTTQVEKGASDFDADTITKVELKLKSGKEFTLEVNDQVLDLDKVYNEAGEKLDLSVNNTQEVYDTVAKFGYIKNKDDKEVTIDVKTGDTDLYTVKDVEKVVIELGNIYSKKNGYTEKGESWVNSLIDAKKGENDYKFNYGGVNYVLANKDPKSVHEDTAKISKEGDMYVLRLNVDVIDSNDDGIAKTLQFVLKGKTQEDLARVLIDLKGENDVVVGHFTKLAGLNRYATAIDVSKEAFDYNEAKTVVIVGAEATIDGLSATPLAAMKKAPVLLANPKTGLDKATLDEIDRACDDLSNKTVYIVGGEKSVPANVEKQLEEKFGAVVLRIAGNDRYATSLEVAKRLSYDKDLKDDGSLYVVGGDGAADAMSVSAVAATTSEVSPTVVASDKFGPILVVNKNGIVRGTRDFINDNKEKFAKKYLIGGENTVSSQVYKELGTVEKRIYGNDRYETNVNIIKEFYGKDKINVGGIAFVSGDSKYLVDAQTAGPLAAMKKLPIVLTKNKLTDSQVDLLDKGNLKDVKTSVYQIGGVVSSDVMSKVVDLLGL